MIDYFIKGVMHILNSFLRLMAWGNLGRNYTIDQNEMKSNLWFMSYVLKHTVQLGPT